MEGKGGVNNLKDPEIFNAAILGCVKVTLCYNTGITCMIGIQFIISEVSVYSECIHLRTNGSKRCL